ncbi:Hypothetical protein NGAL_HAMBI2605_59290 [Neorhizobium galegae bv. orientalis]|nr:Hypothetical protein NGAL_HAMBI2605_59290 [Neorhizobium galegae bv. orientalis]
MVTDDRVRCLACNEVIEDGERVYDDFVNGGVGHADCCGPEPEGFTDGDGNPLKPGDPIPEPYIWRSEGSTPDLSDADIVDLNAIEISHVAMFRVLEGALEIMEVWDPDRAREIEPTIFDQHHVIGDLAAFVRKIGGRATPEVLAQQLVILKHRQTAELSRPEQIALKVFGSVLMELDQFAAEEKARFEAAKAPKAQPVPIPIEDTTMEPVDGPMDTWGQR